MGDFESYEDGLDCIESDPMMRVPIARLRVCEGTAVSVPACSIPVTNSARKCNSNENVKSQLSYEEPASRGACLSSDMLE